MDPLVIRPMREGDIPYMFQTWLGDLRGADHTFLPNDLWYPAHRTALERVLASPKVKVFILADREQDDNIIGYLVRDEEYLHWIHIRRGKWREKGLAKKLLQETESQNLSLVWKTKLGGQRLKNPLRSRDARRSWWTEKK